MNNCLDFIYNYFTLTTIETAIKNKKFELNLSNSNIKELPEDLKSCQNLSKLYLHKNKLKSIPLNIIENLMHLRVLSLSQNLFNEFPSEICELPLLCQLNVSNNQIKSLPTEIGQLQFLAVFWCNNTGLEIIPHEIGFCTKLHTFGARNNNIKELPESFGALRDLLWLTLEGNQIQSVSNCLSHLVNLVHLNLKNNNLQAVPVELEKLKRIRYCYLQHNDIGQINLSNIIGTQFMSMLKLENNTFNADMLEFDIKAFPHATFVYHSESIMDSLFNDIDDQEEWKHSVATTHLNSIETSDDDADIENNATINLPEVAKYFTGFN